MTAIDDCIHDFTVTADQKSFCRRCKQIKLPI
jgi:hypothetical protein